MFERTGKRSGRNGFARQEERKGTEADRSFGGTSVSMTRLVKTDRAVCQIQVVGPLQNVMVMEQELIPTTVR